MEFSQQSFIGMDEYTDDEKSFDGVKKFVTTLGDCDLVIVALDSSIAIEVAYLGIPSLAFYFDKTGDLERRQTLKLSLQNGRMQFLKHIPVISDENELIPEINKLLDNELLD